MCRKDQALWLDVLEPFPWLKLDQDLNFRASEPASTAWQFVASPEPFQSKAVVGFGHGHYLISSLMASSCSWSIMANVWASECPLGESTSMELKSVSRSSSSTSEISGSLSKA